MSITLNRSQLHKIPKKDIVYKSMMIMDADGDFSFTNDSEMTTRSRIEENKLYILFVYDSYWYGFRVGRNYYIFDLAKKEDEERLLLWMKDMPLMEAVELSLSYSNL